MKSRSYESPLRAGQVEQTRTRILEAFVAELAAGQDELSIPRVAKRARVAVRTVYHHFPNRDAQVEAIARYVEQRLGSDDEPRTPADLLVYARRRFQRFRENEALVRAQLAPGVAAQVRARRRKRRDAVIEQCVGATGASGADLKLSTAIVKHLIGAEAAISLLDRQGLSLDDVPQALSWAIEALMKALAEGHGPSMPRGE